MKLIKVFSESKLIMCLSAMAFTAFLAEPTLQGVGLCVFAVVICAIMPEHHFSIKEKNKWIEALAGVTCILSTTRFCVVWSESADIARFTESIHISRALLIVLLAVPGTLLSIYAIRAILYRCIKCAGKQTGISGGQMSTTALVPNISRKAYLFLFAIAVIVITICSKSSPLYLLNNWDDANCFFTVGKSMLNGKVLYRDIYEQKGIYLYALHAAGYLISHTSFLGVYLFEIGAAFLFFVISYKTALLFCNDSRILRVYPILAAVIYGTAAYTHGDSAEEYCLPLLAYALYTGFKQLRCGKSIRRREAFLIGITSGIVLWIKYTMLSFYIGWFIFFAWQMLRSRQQKELIRLVFHIAAGVCVISMPALLYFAVNGALADLWQAYFFNNMFVYSSNGESFIVLNIITNITKAIWNNLPVAMLILLGLLRLKASGCGKAAAFTLCTMTSMAVVIFCSMAYIYYSFIFIIFAPLGLPVLSDLIDDFPRHVQIGLSKKWSCAIFGLVLALLFNNNGYMLAYTEEDLPQYAFKTYIKQVEKPTVLNYGFLDGGFYTVCDILPDCKYFCRLNIKLPDMFQVQDQYLSEGITDFVVTKDCIIENPLYVCVAESRDRGETFRLYALETLGINGVPR